jgi:hypothetical protein
MHLLCQKKKNTGWVDPIGIDANNFLIKYNEKYIYH